MDAEPALETLSTEWEYTPMGQKSISRQHTHIYT